MGKIVEITTSYTQGCEIEFLFLYFAPVRMERRVLKGIHDFPTSGYARAMARES